MCIGEQDLQVAQRIVAAPGGKAYGRLSVMTYNVKGLPWPVTMGREEALDAIANAPTQPGGEGSKPVSPIKIETAEVISIEA